MPAQLPWKFLKSDTKDGLDGVERDKEPAEVQTATAVQLMQRRRERRTSTHPSDRSTAAASEASKKNNGAAVNNQSNGNGDALEPPKAAAKDAGVGSKGLEVGDVVTNILMRLEKDLKGQLAEMDKKLESLCHHASQPRVARRLHDELDVMHVPSHPLQPHKAPGTRPHLFRRRWTSETEEGRSGSNTLQSGSSAKFGGTHSQTSPKAPLALEIARRQRAKRAERLIGGHSSEDGDDDNESDVLKAALNGSVRRTSGAEGTHTSPLTIAQRVSQAEAAAHLSQLRRSSTVGHPAGSRPASAAKVRPPPLAAPQPNGSSFLRRGSSAEKAANSPNLRRGSSAEVPISPAARRNSEVAAIPPPGAPAWLPMENSGLDSPEAVFHRQDLDGSKRGRSRSHSQSTASENDMPDKARRGSNLSSASSRIGHMIRAKIVSVQDRRSQLMQDIWQFLEETDSSRSAVWFARIMQVLVVLNVIFSVLQSQEVPMLEGTLPVIIQILFDGVCTAEVLTRFIVCPNRPMFFLSIHNWVDLVCGCVLILRLVHLGVPQSSGPFGRGIHEFLHLIVPVIWLLKLLRSFEKFHLLTSAFFMACEALPVLLFTLTIIVLSFSAFIYLVEPRENIEALPRAIWLTLVTMTTVGYGDLVPKTSAGSVVVSALIIGSQLYMAIPLGIVGGSFSRVWEDREHLLLIRRTRTRLLQWGYTPQDIVELFLFYDQSKTGELDLFDFSRMMKEMRLGLDPQRIQNLFKSFDADGSGKVDHEEFVSVLYPGCNLFANGSEEGDGEGQEREEDEEKDSEPGGERTVPVQDDRDGWC